MPHIDPDPALFDDRIRHFVAQASGLEWNDVIPGNEGGKRPDGVYASVTPRTPQFNGSSNIRDGGVTAQSVSIPYDVAWFGKEGYGAALRFRLWTKGYAGVDYQVSPPIVTGASDMPAFPFTVSGISELQNISVQSWPFDTIDDADFEQRWQCEMWVSFHLVLELVADWFNVIGLNVKKDNFNQDFEVR